MSSRSWRADVCTRSRQRGFIGVGMKAGASRRQIDISYSTSITTAKNIFTDAASPTDVVDVIVTITGTGVLQHQIDTGSGWAQGSTIKIVNQGVVAGWGGIGQNGASVTVGGVGSATPGNPGEDAIVLHWDVLIDNGGGLIAGGGGGGGGGGAASYFNPPGGDTRQAGGDGGGGGQGYNSASGGPAGTTIGSVGDGDAGNAGSSTQPGAGGDHNWNPASPVAGGAGGSGGGWGVTGGDGARGEVNTGNYSNGAAGGAAGYAIRKNGFNVTWLSGNDATHVKGTVA